MLLISKRVRVVHAFSLPNSVLIQLNPFILSPSQLISAIQAGNCFHRSAFCSCVSSSLAVSLGTTGLLSEIQGPFL